MKDIKNISRSRAQESSAAIERLYITMRHLFNRGFYKPMGVSGETLREALLALRPEIYGSIAEEKVELTKTEKTLHREFDIRFNKVDWKVSIELSYDPSLTELIEVGDQFIKDGMFENGIRKIGIRLSLTHPFMVEFAGADNSKIEPILRIVAALGLSEIIAKDSYKNQGEVRRNFNELISNLSK